MDVYTAQTEMLLKGTRCHDLMVSYFFFSVKQNSVVPEGE